MYCAHCGAQVADASRFCSSCGSAVDISSAPTMDSTPRRHAAAATPPAPGEAPAAPAAARTAAVASPPARPLAPEATPGARFTPGTVLGERYRIVSQLGRGGMGEVYRADDLKLEHAVALKLLPAALAQDATSLARFHREVRVARQVSHPNVCRVFDIGEADDMHFIAMEYIDGEDLATLLRRIGRLPADKALELARQICAGLAAAHEAGLLHRDLKPANVMIDGRGKARLTDFGLADLAGQTTADERSAGTPAYMAPEQLKGGEPSVRTDVYALGLVLYELFTGRRAFEAKTLQELSRLREQGTITHPSVHVKDIDPLVERVILRCLESQPGQRPASALAVAAALPGGDPLAAALAAGETPSPQMVAAAGDQTVVQPRTAWLLLAAAVACLVGVLALVPYASDLALSPIEKSPEALQDRAHELAKRLGYSERPADAAHGFALNYDFLRYRATQVPFPERTRGLATSPPGAYTFWYRQSPRPMRAKQLKGAVTVTDPPEDVSGMLLVYLDGRGRLLRLQGVPPEMEDPGGAAPAAPDWNALFAEAGLDASRFSPAEPLWVPPHAFDTRAAWEGTRAEQPGLKLHVAGAAFHGKVVYFGVFGPWIRPYRQEEAQRSLAVRIGTTVGVSLVVFLILGAIYFSRRNVREGRGDLKGALRVSYGIAVAAMVAWALHTHYVASATEQLGAFFNGLAASLVAAFVAWSLYITLEPFVRRRWPQVLISWSRLLAGQYRDPLVGRDLLVGALGGSLVAFTVWLDNAIPYWFDIPGETPLSGAVQVLGPPSEAVSMLISVFLNAVVSALVVLAMLFLFRVVVRIEWLSIVLAGVAMVLTSLGSENFKLEFPVGLAGAVIVLYILVRFGILALLFAQFFSNLIVASPFTFDFSRWYAGRSVFAILLILGMWLWGLRLALAGRPMFALKLEE